MKTSLLLLLVLLVGRYDNLTGVEACGGGDHDHVAHEEQEHQHHHQHGNDTHYLRAGRNLQDVEICGTHIPSQDEMAQDVVRMSRHKLKNKRTGNKYRAYARLYVVPVVVHIIQPTIYTGYITYQRIMEYINYLNQAFAGSHAPFIFELKDFTRTMDENWATTCGNSDFEVAYKQRLKEGGKETMNVYICTAIGGSTTGFSYLPFQDSDNFVKDGVVIAERAVDDKRLNTLVHEAGHWLGLLHTFGDNTCNPNSPGDLVDDTPQHVSNAREVNCYSNPAMWNTCPKLPGFDPINNYMTYSSDNLCRTKFTEGQVDRMVAQYEIYRKPDERTNSPTSTPALHIVSIEGAEPRCAGYFKRCNTDRDCCAGSCNDYSKGVLPKFCWWAT